MATKRSLFNKPAWAAKRSGPSEDARPIFQQNVYEEILRENEKKEARKSVKIKEKEANELKTKSRNARHNSDDQVVKKRRISANDEVRGFRGSDDEDDDANDDLKKFQSGHDTSSDSESRPSPPRAQGRKARKQTPETQVFVA